MTLAVNKTFKSNMHWISLASEETHHDLLTYLASGNFGLFLLSLGSGLPWLSSLVCYQVSFNTVSSCDESFINHDFTDTGACLLVDESPGELVVRLDDNSSQVICKFEMGAAIILGDGGLRGTALIHYKCGEYRLMALIHVEEICSTNTLHIMKDLTQKCPPRSSHLLLEWSKKPHWTKEGGGGFS